LVSGVCGVASSSTPSYSCLHFPFRVGSANAQAFATSVIFVHSHSIRGRAQKEQFETQKGGYGLAQSLLRFLLLLSIYLPVSTSFARSRRGCVGRFRHVVKLNRVWNPFRFFLRTALVSAVCSLRRSGHSSYPHIGRLSCSPFLCLPLCFFLYAV